MSHYTVNDPSTKDLRQTLRRESTPHERMLWSKIRTSQLGVRFRRQYSVGKYVLDFYAPSIKLAVEIDGSQHLENIAYDEHRTAFLQIIGIRVLRYGNNEINTNIEGVVSDISRVIEEVGGVASTPSQPSPM